MSGFKRRNFLKTAVLGTAGATLLSARRTMARIKGYDSENPKNPSFKLGVASYSLRHFDRQKVIEMVKELQTPYINVKSFHLPYNLSLMELKSAIKEFEDNGLQIIGAGNNNMQKDEAEIKMIFDYAKNAGIKLLVIAPSIENLLLIEKYVIAYDIKVAIHNHGPEDTYFPTPQQAVEKIKNFDPRFGLCVDVGHTVRSGVDVIKQIEIAGDRLLDVHIKDLKDLTDKDSQCIVGEGAMPVVKIFQKLQELKYEGYVNLEYEIEKENPLQGMKQSFAYMRGVMDGLFT